VVRTSAGATAPATTSRILLQAGSFPRWWQWLGVLTFTLGTAVAFAGERADDHGLLAIAAGSAAVGRGVGLRRPLVRAHLFGALSLLLIAAVATQRGDLGLAQAGVVIAGVILFWSPPSPAPGDEVERRRIAGLVNVTAGDALAPFALRADKSYVFSGDGLAAVAYRVRFGVAVVSGDPIGAPDSLLSAAESMLELAADNGWRVGVLGGSEKWSQWWAARGLRAVPIGRDVVIDVREFGLSGRRFRNLRQAVQRTRNAGVTTAVHAESDLPPLLREQLQTIVNSSHRSETRGFSMIMDGLLRPDQRATIVAVAFDRDGRPVAFHRFAIAGGGRDVSQDLPWRAAGAPNGVDERLAHDTVLWAREHGAERLSLSFAAFPELYETVPEGRLAAVSFWLTHRLDRFIRLESLYRYLRKFHAMGERRFVMLRLRDLIWVAAAMLTLEFSPLRGEAIWPAIRGLLMRRTV
jgi:lysylphosphatidylglycerol synthetase-like protein (DUF2156 family)